LTRLFVNPKSGGNGLQRQRWSLHRSELDDADLPRPSLLQIGHHMSSQARLADAGRTDEGQQTGARQKLSDFDSLLLPPNDGGLW
jgi:hypothetical protein